MQNKDFQIGKYYKLKHKLPIKNFYIFEGSNVIFLGIDCMYDYNVIKILYEGILYKFETMYELDTWLKVIDNPTTRE